MAPRRTTLLLLTALLAACFNAPDPNAPSHAPELPGPPREVVAAPTSEPPTSKLVIPITLDAAALERQVQQQVPQVLLDVRDEPLEKGLVGDIRVVRAGAVQVSTASGALSVELPVRIEVKPRPAVARGAKLSIGKVTGALTVQVRFRPEITPAWQIDPRAALTHRWDERAEFQVGPVRIDVADQVDGKLRTRLADVATELDRDLSADLDLRTKVEAAWAQLGQPQQLRDDPPTWLLFRPTTLGVGDPRLDTDGVHLALGVEGTLALVVGAKPDAPPAGALPNRRAPTGTGGAHLAVPVALRWDALVPALRTQLEGQRQTAELPTGGAAELTVLRLIDVYPSGGGVAVGVQVRLHALTQQTDATVWLVGKPEVQGTDLRIGAFSYSAQSDSSWLDAAHAQVSDSLRELIAERLVVPLADRLAEVKDQVNQQLNGGAPPAGATLTAQVTDVSITGVQVTDEALVVLASADGTASVTLHTLPPR